MMIDNSCFYYFRYTKNIQCAERYENLWQRCVCVCVGGCVCAASLVKEFRGNLCRTIVFVALLLYLDNKVQSHKSPHTEANILLHFSFFFSTIADPGQYINHFSYLNNR